MKKFVPFSIIMFSALLLFGPCSARAATTTSITQYGFTWNFNSAVEYGRFVNGDYWVVGPVVIRSEEHTSELQSRLHLVCRLLFEKTNHFFFLFFFSLLFPTSSQLPSST